MTSAADDAVFLDANILVFASLSQAEAHSAALSRIDSLWRAGRELWVSRQVLREYLSVVTRPDTPPQPLELHTALAAVSGLTASLRVADETEQTQAILLQLMSRYSVTGRRIHDCNIVATMLAAGVRSLLTDNVRHFKQFEREIHVLPLR